MPFFSFLTCMFLSLWSVSPFPTPLRRKIHLMFSEVKVHAEGLEGPNKMRQAWHRRLRWGCQKQLQDAANFCLAAVIKGSLRRFIGLLYLRPSIIAAIYTHYGIWQGFMLAYTPGWLIWQWCTRWAAARLLMRFFISGISTARATSRACECISFYCTV